jgi:drug/metabolite transporter (DMT)-like permease
MVLATGLWGATFVVIRDSLAALDPAPLVFARFAVSALIFALLLLPRARVPDRATLAGGAVAGLLAAAGYLFQAIGLATTRAGSSAFLTCAGTLGAAFFAWPLLGQRPSRALVAGIGVAIVGSALLSLHAGFRLGRGELWTLAGALAYALQIVAVARVAPRADAITLTGVQSLVIALALAPWAGVAVRELRALDAGGAWRFAYLAIAGSVVAPLLQVSAQGVLPAGRIGLLFALEPLFALAFALTVGAERFEPRWWLGAALILSAVLAVELRSARAPGDGPRATP